MSAIRICTIVTERTRHRPTNCKACCTVVLTAPDYGGATTSHSPRGMVLWTFAAHAVAASGCAGYTHLHGGYRACAVAISLSPVKTAGLCNKAIPDGVVSFALSHEP